MEQTEAYALEHIEHEKHEQEHAHLHNRHHADRSTNNAGEDKKLIGSWSESSLFFSACRQPS
jgi:hypothetical protein